MPDYKGVAATLEGPSHGRIRLGLEATIYLLDRLGNPHRELRGALVAGTNGKGSVCSSLDYMSRATGRRTVLLVKPHLRSWTERILVDGQRISEDEFARLGSRVLEVSASFPEPMQPTGFEILTAMGFLAAREAEADITVCEVGLGGRLDSTNVANLGVAVITNISLDHTDLLGDSIEQIAAEKAAIIKEGNTVITGVEEPALAVVRAAAHRASASLNVVKASDWFDRTGSGHDCTEIDLLTPGNDPMRLTSPLRGGFQGENLAVAAVTARALHIPDDAIVRGAAQTVWPGRIQIIESKPLIVLDGAHNVAGIRAAGNSVLALAGGRRVVAIFGAMRDKLLSEMVDALFELTDLVIYTRVQSARAANPAELPSAERARITATITEALDTGRHMAGPDGVILVCGSLSLVGAAQEVLGLPE